MATTEWVTIQVFTDLTSSKYYSPRLQHDVVNGKMNVFVDYRRNGKNMEYKIYFNDSIDQSGLSRSITVNDEAKTGNTTGTETDSVILGTWSVPNVSKVETTIDAVLNYNLRYSVYPDTEWQSQTKTFSLPVLPASGGTMMVSVNGEFIEGSVMVSSGGSWVEAEGVMVSSDGSWIEAQ